MAVSEDVARKLLHMVQNVRARNTPEVLLMGDTRGKKRARMLEVIGDTILPRQLEFTSIQNGLENARLTLNVSSARVTETLVVEPSSLGENADIDGADRIQAAQQLGDLITRFSRAGGDIFLSSQPPENPPEAEDVGITLSEILAVVTVEDLPEDAQDASSDFYDLCEDFSLSRAELSKTGIIQRSSGEPEILPDLAALLAMDLEDWTKDSSAAIPMPQLIVMRPERGRDPALAMFCDGNVVVVSVHETRKLGSVVTALKELQRDDDDE